MVADWGDEELLAEAVAAFEALTDETRQAIVAEIFEETFDEPGGIGFSDLRRAVGVRDPGRFHYHVEKLTGTLLTNRDGEFWPRNGRTATAVSFAASHRSSSVASDATVPLPEDDGRAWAAPTRYACPHCETFLAAWYDGREQVQLRCLDHGIVFLQTLPPGLATADPEEWVDAAVRRQHRNAEELAAGRCPWCRGTVDRTLRYGRVSYSFEGPEAPWTPLWSQHRCLDCPHESWLPLGAALTAPGPVRRFFHGAGVDIREEPCPTRYVTDREFVDGDGPHPDRATLVYGVDDARLSVTVADDLELLAVEHEGDPRDPPTGSDRRDRSMDAARTVYDASVMLRAAPLVTDDVVCVVGLAGNCHALDRETGERRWTAPTEGRHRVPLAADGTLYLGDWEGTVAALDLASGVERWSTTVAGRPVLRPAVVDGLLLVGAQETGLHALDAASGERVWTTPLGDRGAWFSGPVLAGDRVVVGGREALFAVDPGGDAVGPDARRVDWSVEFGRPPRVGAVPDGTAYLGAGAELVAVDVVTGERRWSVECEASVLAPAVWDGRVYATAGTTCRCVAADTGEVVWSAETEGRPFARPAVRAGAVYAVRRDGGLVAFDASTGERRWEAQPLAPHRVRTKPAIAEGTLYLGDADGRVAAVDPTDGSRVWRASIRS